MFNSLPENFKKKIRSEYKLHFFIVVLFSVLVMQILFLILLFPAWFLSLSKEQDVVAQAEDVNKQQLDSNIDLMNFTVKSMNARLLMINTTLEYPELIPFVDSILSNKTKNISIKELVYTSLDKNTAKITLAGTGATREELMFFVKRLEETKKFEKVDLPISNLTKDKDINFSISMTITSS